MMNNNPLNLAFIGGGINSAVGATHCIAAQMDGRFRVVAGCFSRHPEINLATGRQWHVSADRVYASADELLTAETGKIDAVVVLTPTPSHRQPVIAALAKGYSVICEKALASSVEDAVDIIRAAEQTGGYLAVTYNYTGYPMLRELKQMIASDKLGVIRQIHVEMPQEGFSKIGPDGEPIVPQHWRLADGTIPTISLDLGVHLHHVIGFLTGQKPIEVVALQSSMGHFSSIKDNTLCIARYSAEIECAIWYSKTALGHRNGLRVRVYGTRGSAEWFQMEPESLTWCDNKGTRTILDRASADARLSKEPRYNRFKAGHPAGFLEAFANLYSDIADELTHFQSDRAAPRDSAYSARHALDGLAMLEAITSSSKEKVWKPVSQPLP